MNYLRSLNNRLTVGILLAAFVIVAFFLHAYRNGFPCLNSDEAAFGYNALSIAQTGKDEYGTLAPSRLKSFGENKLPLMAYLTVPFVSTLGLNEVTTRMIVLLIGIATPLLFYFLTKELTGRKDAALLAAFFSSVSPVFQILSRHAHEAMVAYFFISLSLLFFLRFMRKNSVRDLVLFSLANGLALFSHHIAKPFSVFLFGWFIVYWCLSRKSKQPPELTKSLVILFVPIVIFAASEFMHPTNRIGNLVFWQNKGFTLKINELRNEHNAQILHNKVTEGVRTMTNQYLTYFSPQFLVTEGDRNIRFGYPGISPITVVEYVFLFIGVAFAFYRQLKHRFLLMTLLLISPLTASLSWAELSVTRALYLFVPVLIFSAYGFVGLLESLKQKYLKWIVATLCGALYLFFVIFSWDYYFFHYQKKPEVLHSWQCGYKELGSYIKQNYDRFDRFYITRKNGQPYIYLLFYLGYAPEKYQKQAWLSAPDEYGFGQVERFDRFDFNFKSPTAEPKTAYVGFPEDFTSNGISFDASRMQKIQSGTEDVFWIYENQ